MLVPELTMQGDSLLLRTTRRSRLLLVLVALGLFLLPGVAVAEGWSAVLAQAPAPTGGIVEQESRSYFVEIAIVVLLAGAALFAVCRSSNRA